MSITTEDGPQSFLVVNGRSSAIKQDAPYSCIHHTSAVNLGLLSVNDDGSDFFRIKTEDKKPNLLKLGSAVCKFLFKFLSQ